MKKRNIILPLALASAAVLATTACSGKDNKKVETVINIDAITVTSNGNNPIVLENGSRVWICSADGVYDNNGSYQYPTTFKKAYQQATAGDYILLKEGVYNYEERLRIGEDLLGEGTHKGKPGKYITIQPITNDARVVFDFSEMTFDGNNRGIQVYSDFWHFKNLEIRGAGDNGMYVAGSHNIVENCIFYNNRDTGLQLGRAYSEDASIDLWPSYNLIKNCTSYGNFDDETLGENADGFAAKLTIGVGNIFDGCIAFRNSDDGWDLYAKEDSGNIGTVILYNCVSFENGYLPYTIKKENMDGTRIDTFDTLNGDGIGFKLGGSVMEGDVLVENCLSFDNKLHGFGDNSNPGTISVKNITAFNNCAGLNDDGTISSVRGLKDIVNKSNNIDLARATTSYNSYYGVLSYINNQNGYNAVGDSGYNTDAFKGSVAYSIFQTGYNNGEEYVAFESTTDASSHHTDTVDVAFSAGTPYEALTDAAFADLKSVNAICGTKDKLPELTEIHNRFRNADHSVNMGDKLRVVDENLLKFANGDPIGASLSKSKWEDYTHASYYSFKTADSDMTDEEIAVLSASTVCDPLTSAAATYQNFDIPRLIQGCEITWESDNEEIVRIDNNETESASKSVFSKAYVTVPKQDTLVTLTATIKKTGTENEAVLTKEFPIMIKARNQDLGELSSTGPKAIRVDMYSQFLAPRIYAQDVSANTYYELPKEDYELTITYRYAADKNSKFYNIDNVYTSVPGVYEVTANAVSNKNPKLTSKFVYHVYVVDPDCSIDFMGGESTVALTKDGFAVSGDLSNIEGGVYALVTDTAMPGLTAADLIANENAQYYHIDSDSIVANFNADNMNVKSGATQYYGYYCVVNKNESNISSATVYSFTTKNVEVSTKEQFMQIARKGSIDGIETTSTTIYSLTADLDFADTTYDILDKNKVKAFSGLFNGNDHTISNITIDTRADADQEKTANVFYKLSNGTIMNVNFDNIRIEAHQEKGKLTGIVGDMAGGYLHDIHATRIYSTGRESDGGIVGQVTGGNNYITQCSLYNPTDKVYNLAVVTAENYDGKLEQGLYLKNGENYTLVPEKTPFDESATYYTYDLKYIIATANKYAGGIVANAQMNSDQSTLLISIKDCYVKATIGDGKDAAGNTGGILGRVKNDTTDYTAIIENCYYEGTIIAKGQYNAGMLGDLDNGSGKIYVNRNMSLAAFIWNGQDLDVYRAGYDAELKYAHKNSNPIIGRATSGALGEYSCVGNIGTWTEYYSKLVKSNSIMFDYSDFDPETGEFVIWTPYKSVYTGALKFSEEIWDLTDINNVHLKNYKA